jgi:hypothetical protein
MTLNPEQVYKLGAESLEWNNSTAAGKALIAEDMALFKLLPHQTAAHFGGSARGGLELDGFAAIVH